MDLQPAADPYNVLSYHEVDSFIFIGQLLTRYIPYPTPRPLERRI